MISSISPLTGSYYGGTLLTITGINFTPDPLKTLVSIGDYLNTLCVIESVAQTQITCRMPHANRRWEDNLTQHTIVTSSIIADSICPGQNCEFTYMAKDLSPNISSLSLLSVSSKISLIIAGSGLNITNA